MAAKLPLAATINNMSSLSLLRPDNRKIAHAIGSTRKPAMSASKRKAIIDALHVTLDVKQVAREFGENAVTICRIAKLACIDIVSHKKGDRPLPPLEVKPVISKPAFMPIVSDTNKSKRHNLTLHQQAIAVAALLCYPDIKYIEEKWKIKKAALEALAKTKGIPLPNSQTLTLLRLNRQLAECKQKLASNDPP